MSKSVETFHFQTETTQLLDLMIHSLYTNKDIFLRELISNASDALDKLRFEALTKPELLKDGEKLEIRLETDEEKRTLTISDNGIGMSREEVIQNIGTIAHSGTRELFEQWKKNKDDSKTLEMIGQFGVGFYSSFMVADEVTLITRRAGEEGATIWHSKGDGTYTIEEGERDDHGTSVILKLKPVDLDNNLNDYVDEYVLKSIVKRYSDFITYPIILKVRREEFPKDEEGNPKEDEEKIVTFEDETINSMKPIWTRPSSEVAEEEYEEFYKHISNDWEKPLQVIPLKAEGTLEYQALLFIPSRPPYDLYNPQTKAGLQLYVRRVLIMNHCEDLLPPYLRFVKGVVDSSDLPLNVSRELLQHDRVLTSMRKWLTKQILKNLKKMKEDDWDKYLKFWKPFGRVLKEGLVDDYENRSALKDLLIFESSHDSEKMTDLKGYLERMKEGQEEIFYLTGESRHVIENSPHLEAFKAKDIEVLYLTDAVDEVVADYLTSYEGKKFKSIGKGTVELGSEEEKKKAEEELEEKKKELSDLLEFIKKHLDEHISEVRLSNRLTTSPVCLVTSEMGYTPRLERWLQETQNIPKQKRIMELNPEHELLKKMQERFENDKDDPLLKAAADLLLGYAYLAEGSPLPDPVKFNNQVAEVMTQLL